MRIYTKEIRQCAQCPHCFENDAGIGFSFGLLCHAVTPNRHLKYRIVEATGFALGLEPIPDWCPLPVKE
jgi:hypothetical protein